MHLTPTLLLAGAALAAAQSTTPSPPSSSPSSTTSSPATTHTITVGGNANAFSPPSTTASVGDSVLFLFSSPATHNVLQAEYARPCEARDPGAFFSGDLSSRGDNDEFLIHINTTTPIWYFCAYARHCQDGMVGVINPPQVTTGGFTLEGFEAASKATKRTNNTVVLAAQGGSLGKGGEDGGSGTGTGTGTEEGNVTATNTEEVPAASSSTGAAAGLVVQAGLGGLVGLVAMLML